MINTINFRNNVIRFWTDYVEWINDYTSLTGSGQDTSLINWFITRYVNNFYNDVREIYGRTNAEAVGMYISGIYEGLTQAKVLIENKGDIKPLTEKISGIVINRLCVTLQDMNPEWKVEITTPLFNNIWEAWTDHCKASLSKDITAADAAESKAMLNALAFADAFINGAIKQYTPIFF